MSGPRIVTRKDRPARVLEAGVHEISIEQTVEIDVPKIDPATKEDLNNPKGRVHRQEIALEVRLPRFQPPEVTFRYPQPGTSAHFGDTIPHIVLGKAELPWERTAGGGLPWLALIAFAGDDRPKIVSGVVEDLAKAPEPQAADGANPICKPALAGSHVPQEWEKKDNPPCRYIDIPWEAVARLAPRLEEVQRLAHVQKSAQQRAASGSTDDAAKQPVTLDTSAVLLNRLPVKGLIAVPNAKKDVPIDVHLVSLEGLASLLPRGDGAAGLPGAVPFTRLRVLTLDHWSFTHTGSAPAGAKASEFRRLCTALSPRSLATTEAPLGAEGYVRFEGGTRALYYRGPLLPVPDGEYEAKPWESPADCLRQCKKDGAIDISYAAAWQMGRLVSMGDPNLGIEFSKVREGWRYLDVTRRRNCIEDWIEPPDTPEELARLEKIMREDEAAGIRIARLWLLESVPLHYLIPDASMLPAESICAIHMDRDWADAWCWGAFSAGSHSPTDYSLGSVDGMKLMYAADQAECRDNGVMGLLIRSKVVPMWPALGVELWRKKPDGKLESARVVRRALLAPDVLLVLAVGSFSEAVLNLPADCLHYEVGANDTAVPSGTSAGSADVATSCLQAADPVKFSLETNAP